MKLLFNDGGWDRYENLNPALPFEKTLGLFIDRYGNIANPVMIVLSPEEELQLKRLMMTTFNFRDTMFSDQLGTKIHELYLATAMRIPRRWVGHLSVLRVDEQGHRHGVREIGYMLAIQLVPLPAQPFTIDSTTIVNDDGREVAVQMGTLNAPVH